MYKNRLIVEEYNYDTKTNQITAWVFYPNENKRVITVINGDGFSCYLSTEGSKHAAGFSNNLQVYFEECPTHRYACASIERHLREEEIVGLAPGFNVLDTIGNGLVNVLNSIRRYNRPTGTSKEKFRQYREDHTYRVEGWPCK